jgi:uncharacterized membrane-anchored protein
MAQSQVTRAYRQSIRAMLAGLVMLAGAVAAFAAKAPVAGVVLLVLMLVCAMAGFVGAVSYRNRAVALARQAKAEQRGRLNRPGR